MAALKKDFRFIRFFSLASLFVLPGLSEGALRIDDFNNTGGDGNPLSLQVAFGESESQFQSAPLIGSISNNRNTILDEVFGVTGISLVDQINPDTTEGYISFRAAQLFSGADLEFSYTGLGGVDLTEGGKNDQFELFVRSQSNFGFGDATWAVGVEDTDGDFEITSSVNLVEGFNRITMPTSIVNYASAEEIYLYVDAVGIAVIESVQFDDFQAVPEPAASLAVTALFCLGVALFRRRL